jgi:hypothetical protein
MRRGVIILEIELEHLETKFASVRCYDANSPGALADWTFASNFNGNAANKAKGAEDSRALKLLPMY